VKLGTRRKSGLRDGELVVVRRDGQRCQSVPHIAPSLQYALDHWPTCAPRLQDAYLALSEHAGEEEGEPVVDTGWSAPLPRAYEWLDASAYLSHVELVRKARGAPLPEDLQTHPLVYQGGSGVLLGPRDPIELPDPSWGLDFEGEVCVVLGDTPQGTTVEQASACVRLLVLANDISYRNLIPSELARGFGFVLSKPATAFSPLAITPDELGPAWRAGRVHLPLRSTLNGVVVGEIDAGLEMHFSFFDLIAHLCRTRSYTAGTIVGSGTVSSRSDRVGVSCLAERRMREIIACGTATTPFLAVGDEIAIDMMAPGNEHSLLGTIRQTVVKPISPGGA